MRKLYLKNDEKKAIYYLVSIYRDYAILESVDGDIVVISDLEQIKMLDLANREENKETEKIELRDFLLQKSIFIDLILKDINTDIEFLNESYDKSSLIKDAFLKKYKENG